jgi:hypothetical protein
MIPNLQNPDDPVPYMDLKEKKPGQAIPGSD